MEDYQRTVVLPAELVSFEGTSRDRGVQLDWVSASEEYFDRYEIEWSNDTENWRTIDVVYGAGGINTQYYQFLHEEATKVNYYRLKMVDLDETYEYSNVINVISDCSAISVLVLYPNPVMEVRSVVSIKALSNTELLLPIYWEE
ncbi:MAG: hypothetical protein ACI94Y_003415 [Maribacter sp.]